MKDLINPLLDIRYINFVMYNSHNGQTHFENRAANATRSLNCM